MNRGPSLAMDAVLSIDPQPDDSFQQGEQPWPNDFSFWMLIR
jgi:hypothetical protein